MMRMVTAAAMLAGALVPAAGQAAPYKVTGGPGSVWVLDEDSGALTWCRQVAPSGPKVIDVFGADAQVRPEKEYPARPDCSVAMGAPDGGVPGFAAGGYGGAAGYGAAGYGVGGYGVGGYGIGGYGAGYGGMLSVAVRPGMLGDGSSGYQVGSGVGMLGDGTFGYGVGVPDNQVIIVRPGSINVNLY